MGVRGQRHAPAAP